MRNEKILTRRSFVQAIFAGSAALALVGCGGGASLGGDGENDPDAGGDAQGTTDPGAPVWQAIPPLVFVEGVASSISIAELVSDPEGDPITITKNDVELPPGVTYDAAGKRFVYDGVGGASSTSGHVLSASDG